jgi:O-acetyl-ADP-ribose deacetylase (regulator of RNase III)
LTDGDETVLVNASNTSVALGSGVSAAIRAACGPDYQRHVEEALLATYGQQGMEPGQVLFTDAGAHPRAKWVAHVAVMDYREAARGSPRPTLDTIRAGCTNLIEGIEALSEPVTVAMVALGAGVGRLGVRDPTRIACQLFAAHAKERRERTNLDGVTFYGYSQDEHAAILDVVRATFPDGVP